MLHGTKKGRDARWLCSVVVVLLWCGILTTHASAQNPFGQGEVEWWNRSEQFRTRYYTVKSDLPREEAIALATHMDLVFASYAEMFQGLGRWRPKQLAVCLFASREDYVNTLGSRFKANGAGSAGMCIARGNLVTLVAWRGQSIDELKRTLQHEGFHQFASHLFPNLPTWANEGMAEVFERGIVINGKVILGDVSRFDKRQLVGSMEKKEFRRFRDFLTMDQKEWNAHVQRGQNAGVNYLQAWCLCHFFLYADDSRHQQQFLQFLSLLNQGEPYEMAFVQAFGMPRFEQMESSWANYVEQLAPTDYRQTIINMEFLAQGLLKLREQKIHPISFDELKSELQKLNFEYTPKAFGHSTALLASNEKLYSIPSIRGQENTPAFRLVDVRGKAIKPPTENRPARRQAAPLTLETEGYLPHEFRVRWKRSGKSYQPTFEVK